MINTIKKFLGLGSLINYKELLKNGAKIIDVRTKGEYSFGHISGSINIPLNELKEGAKLLKKYDVLITCCASGMRSASARSVLNQMGFSEVYNGGGWTSLQNKI